MIATILISLMFFILVVFDVGFSSSSIDTYKWYWGWRDNTKDILAYQPNGETHILHIDGLQSVVSARRLTPQTAAAFLFVNDQIRLYKLSPESAEPFFGDLDEEASSALSGWGFVVKSLAESNFLILPNTSYFQYGVILNTRNNTLEAIEINAESRVCLDPFDDCIRISQDRQKIRYISAILDEQTPVGFTIKELDVTSLAESTLFTYQIENDQIVDYHSACSPDIFGERWVCTQPSESLGQSSLQYWLIQHDGSVTFLKEEIEWLPRWSIFFSGNDLITVDYGEGSLEIETEILGNTKIVTIGRSLPVNYAVQLSNGNVLVLGGSDWYLHTHNAPLQYLGTTPCCPPQYLLSKNQRWLATWSNEEKADQVWDLSQSKLALEIPVTGLRYVRFADTSFYYTDDQTRDRQTYFYTHNTISKLPTGGIYFEIVAELELLYEAFGQDNQAQGIYLYDVDSETFSLIAENTEHIPL